MLCFFFKISQRYEASRARVLALSFLGRLVPVVFFSGELVARYRGVETQLEKMRERAERAESLERELAETRLCQRILFPKTPQFHDLRERERVQAGARGFGGRFGGGAGRDARARGACGAGRK